MVLILLKTGRSEAFAKDGQNSKLVLLCYNHHRWKIVIYGPINLKLRHPPLAFGEFQPCPGVPSLSSGTCVFYILIRKCLKINSLLSRAYGSVEKVYMV